MVMNYRSFVDADDVILEDAFDSIDISDRYQLIIFDIDVIENCKESTWKVLSCNPGMVEKKNVIEELVTSNRMNSPCSKLFLNSCIKQHEIRFDENMVTGEDMNFVIDYTQYVTNIYYTGESAYCYHREEVSRVTRIKKFPEIYFNNLSFLRDKLERFSSSVSNVFVPKVNRIVAESGDDRELTKLFTKVGRIQAIILGLILSGFVFLGIPFVKIWAGSEYVDSYTVALLLIAPVTVPLIQNLGIEIQRAKNMHKARAIVYLFIALANVALSIPLIKVMGPAGAALGTAISLIAGNIFFMNWYYHARIGMNMFYFWKEIAKFMPALIAPCMLGIIIMNFANITGLIKLGVFAIIYTIVYGLSMYFLGMNEEEKQLVMEPVRKIIKK